MERRKRVWFAGNDHTNELAEVNDLLADLTDQLGTGPSSAARLSANGSISALPP